MEATVLSWLRQKVLEDKERKAVQARGVSKGRNVLRDSHCPEGIISFESLALWEDGSCPRKSRPVGEKTWV